VVGRGGGRRKRGAGRVFAKKKVNWVNLQCQRLERFEI
jgi:hypothetical protein